MVEDMVEVRYEVVNFFTNHLSEVVQD